MTLIKSIQASGQTSIRLVALREQYEQLKPGIDAAIRSVIERSAFISGPEVVEFERWFADYCGVRHALGVASGTAAIELILRALGTGPGDEVVTAANTFVATAAAVSATGARPVFIDVEERTCNLDAARLQAAIGTRTKAVIPVHLYGRPAAMRKILEAAGGVPVIEDAAQAHGARYCGARTGSIATAGCFSFYPTKNLGAFGDAGLVTTNDDALAARVRLLRDHGRVARYEHAIAGQTARLDNLQAAVLSVQASALEAWNARRRQAAAWYREMLPPELGCPEDDPGNESVYHVFAVRVRDGVPGRTGGDGRTRDDFRRHLEANGIATAVHYPTPLHLQPAFRDLGYRSGDFPVTEALARSVVSLPMHPFLERPQIEYIANVAAGFFQHR
jgi:dTDP-4-amino-4,6-dideoxygalactose transaminase